MRVVFDTNIFSSDFRFQGGVFKTFFQQYAQAGHSVHLLEIVQDETVNKYKEEVVDTLSKLKTTQKESKLKVIKEKLDNITDRRITIDSDEEDIDVSVNEYKNFLSAKLRQDINTSRLMIYPNTNHRDLVKKDLNRKKPFSPSGKGYRDALIWESIVNIIEQYGTEEEKIAFISNDGDFSIKDGETLHPDLIADLKKRKLPEDSVVLFKKLETFVDEQIKSVFEVLDDLKDKLNKNDALANNLKEKILKNLINEYIDFEFEGLNESFYLSLEGIRFSDFIEIIEFKVTDARKFNVINSANILIDLSVKVKCKLTAHANTYKIHEISHKNNIQIQNSIFNSKHLDISFVDMFDLALSAFYYEDEQDFAIQKIKIALASSDVKR